MLLSLSIWLRPLHSFNNPVAQKQNNQIVLRRAIMALTTALRHTSSLSSSGLRHRLLPSLLLHPKLTSTSSSAKVSDRIVKFSAIDPSGQKQQVLGLAGHTLLKSLANTGLIDPASHRLEEIEACSAECEVSIAQEWLEKLPPRSYDEEYVLKRNSRARVLNKHSRLGCQVVLTKDLEGMVVAVPEPKPWDIP